VLAWQVGGSIPSATKKKKSHYTYDSVTFQNLPPSFDKYSQPKEKLTLFN
jgi:hypothetical protein